MCDTMTDYQDDSDGELPSISLSQSTGVKTEFEMPPAEEVVSRREREAAVERELQKLRDAEAAAAAEAAARRADKDCQMLSSKVTALEVSDVSEARQRQVEELTAMAEHLPAEDAAFLTTYAKALKDAPSEAAAQAITNQVVCAVRRSLVRGAPLAAGGAAAALLAAPPAPDARRALHAVLDRVASATQVELVVRAARAALRGAARRLAAHDAARSGARRGSDGLAAALLASAQHEIVHGSDSPSPPWPLSPLAAGAARARFRRLPAARQLLLLRAAGRALAGAGAGAGAGEGEGGELLGALLQPLPRAPLAKAEDAPVDVSLRHQVLANVAKLHLLFGAGRAPQHREVDEQMMVNPESENDNSQTEEQIVSKDIDEEMMPITEMENNDLNTSAKDTETEELPRTPENLEIKQEQTDATMHMDSKTVLNKEAEEVTEVKEAMEVKEEAEVNEEMEVDKSSPQRKKTRRSPRVAARCEAVAPEH